MTRLWGGGNVGVHEVLSVMWRSSGPAARPGTEDWQQEMQNPEMQLTWWFRREAQSLANVGNHCELLPSKKLRPLASNEQPLVRDCLKVHQARTVRISLSHLPRRCRLLRFATYAGPRRNALNCKPSFGCFFATFLLSFATFRCQTRSAFGDKGCISILPQRAWL